MNTCSLKLPWSAENTPSWSEYRAKLEYRAKDRCRSAVFFQTTWITICWNLNYNMLKGYYGILARWHQINYIIKVGFSCHLYADILKNSGGINATSTGLYMSIVLKGLYGWLSCSRPQENFISLLTCQSQWMTVSKCRFLIHHIGID